jgi:hypothetical protein
MCVCVWGGGGCVNIFENISFTGVMLNEFLEKMMHKGTLD